MSVLAEVARALTIAAVGVLGEATTALASVGVDVPHLGAVLQAVLVMGMSLFEVAGALAIATVGVLFEVTGALAGVGMSVHFQFTGQNLIGFIARISVRLGALVRFTAVRLSSSCEARVGVSMAGFHGFLGFPADQNLFLDSLAVVTFLGMGVLFFSIFSVSTA